MDSYEILTENGSPVTITVDGCLVTAELDGLTMSWMTDTDAAQEEDLEEMTAKAKSAHIVLTKAVRREKLVQAVRQALAVAYALRHGLTVTAAWDALALGYTERDVRATEGSTMRDEVHAAREDAWALLAAMLRSHGWVQHGDVLGPTGDAGADRVVDLDTGRVFIQGSHQMVSMDREMGAEVATMVTAWTDTNGEPVTETEAGKMSGRWWASSTGVWALPFCPWTMESQVV